MSSCKRLERQERTADGPYIRYEVGQGGSGTIVDFRIEPDIPQGSWAYGEGVPHHVAFEVDNHEVQTEVKFHLEGLGFHRRLRNEGPRLLRSIYVRTPGGALFEATVSKPQGFLVDETYERLGTTMQIPPFFANRRPGIARQDRAPRLLTAERYVGLNRHMSVQAVWRGAWPTRGEPLAIVLPGRAQPVQFALEIITRLSLPSLNCVALSAEGNSWYPGRFMEPIESNQPDVDHSLERIESLVAEAERRGIPRHQIALLGFSQGACVVCEYAYRRPFPLG